MDVKFFLHLTKLQLTNSSGTNMSRRPWFNALPLAVIRLSQAVVGAHLNKHNGFPPLKMHYSDKVIKNSDCFSSLVRVVKSLLFDSDLKKSALLKSAVQKLPTIIKESWSLLAVKKLWVKPTHLGFINAPNLAD